MNSTIHERPGVYSSYDASSVVSASAAAKTIGAAAVATKGTANKVELITSYEEGKSVFGEDASGVYGMSTLLKFLFANGAGAVKAVAVGKDESEEKDYASAFAALSDEEDVGVMVCDSALRTRFARSKNTAQSRGAIRSQVVLELEEMKSREIVDSYGEVLVSALKSDPTVCLVEFSFTVAHGLNRIYLTAHITV